jgi:hypothetical protein
MRTTYLYAIGRKNGPVKIGVSHSPEYRLSEFRTACPFPIKLLHAEPCESREVAYSDEAFAHRFLAHNRMHGEWFDVDGSTAVQTVQDTVQFGAHFRERAAAGDFA